MTIKLIAIGKTDNKELQNLINTYTKRLSFYTKFSLEIIPDVKHTKSLSENEQRTKEGILLLKKLKPRDVLVLLDEKGKPLDSIQFSSYLQKQMNAGAKQIVFAVGGPYGFSEDVYNTANEKLSLSKMTFSHQMIRLFFIEQLYRGFTILKNEPYHHQ